MTRPNAYRDRQPDLPATADIIAAMQDGVILLDRDLRLRAFNDAYLVQTHLQQGDLVPGMPMTEVWRKLIDSGALRSRGETVEEVLAQRISKWSTEFEARERLTDDWGQVFEISRTRMANGDVLGIHREITEQVAHEADTARDHRLLQRILAAVPVGVAVIDRDLRFVAFNPRFLDLYDIPDGALQSGAHFNEVVAATPSIQSLSEEQRRSHVAERRGFLTDPNRNHVIRQVGATRSLDISKVLLGEGAVLLTLRDVSEAFRRQSQSEDARLRAERRANELGHVFTRLGHELRNPLSGMLGISSLLERSNLGAQNGERVKVLQDSGKMLLRLIEDLMDLGRMEVGNFSFRPEATDLYALVLGCVTLARSQDAALGVPVNFEANALSYPSVEVDPVRLRQVLMNLIGNAMKFSPGGSVAVSIHGEATEGALKTRLVISDTGVGIAKQDLARIFGEYERLEDGPGAVPGLGLGLAIVRRLVDGMGGQINIRSTLGEGTEVTVKLELPLG